MFKIDENYSDYYAVDATKYPGGMGINSSGVDTTDGTPWLAKMFNNCIGWMQALYIKAFGNLNGISNDAENCQTSDVVRALEKIQTDNNTAERAISEGAYFKKTGGAISGNVDIDGTLAAKGTTINGTLQVEGDIIQNGESYETHAEKIYTKDDLIVTRDGAVGALGVDEYSGYIVRLADGTKDVAVVVDRNGNARVGNYNLVFVYSSDGVNFYSDPDMTDPVTIPAGKTPRAVSGDPNRYYYANLDDTEPIATRDDEANMTNDKLIKWNAIAKRIETTPYAASDIASLIAAVAEMELQGNLDTHGGVLSPTPRWLRFNPESKKSLVIKAQTIIKVGTHVYKAEGDESFDLTTYLNAVGKDYFVYLNWAEVGGADSWSLSASLTKSADTATSRYIGRLHTLCAAVPAGTSMTAPAAPSSGSVIGDDFLVKPYTDKDADFKEFYTHTVSAITTGTYYDVVTCGHPLAGFGAGDILPESVFCLTFKPDTLFEDAMVYEPTLGVAIDVYLQSGKGNGTRSLFGASTTRSRPQISHEADMLAVGKRLLSDEEFQAAALGSNEKTSIQGTVEASIQTAGGHVDTASRRMTSAIGCEDCCGGVWQWLRDVSALGTGTAFTNINGTGEYVGNTGWITIDGQNAFGEMYNCSSALLAGGFWSDGSYCGSRARDAAHARSNASAVLGGRGSSRVIRGL